MTIDCQFPIGRLSSMNPELCRLLENRLAHIYRNRLNLVVGIEMDDEGIHWYALDEDVSFESFEYDDPEPVGISRVFLSHPELNASAVGRRLGISQSLMAQYINGTKKPSKERERLIMEEIANIGKELQKVCA